MIRALAWVVCVAACASAPQPRRTPRPARQPSHVAIVVAHDTPRARSLDRRAVVIAPHGAEPSAAGVAAGPLERARTAYRDLDFETSLAAAGDAQLVLEERASTQADFDALTQALLYRGLDELALGRIDRARDALRTVVLLRPDLVLEEARFPPEVRALHVEMAAAVRADPPAALTVTVDPPGAAVSIDGRRVGRAPLTVHGQPGRHYIEVTALGHERRLLAVSLQPQGSPPLHVALPSATPEHLASQLVERSISDPALTQIERRMLRSRLAADVVIVARPDGESIRGIRFTLDRAGMRSAHARDLATLIARLDPRGDGPPRDGDSGSEDDVRGGLLSSPWTWGIAAALLVGAGVTTTVLIVTDEPDPRVVLTPDP